MRAGVSSAAAFGSGSRVNRSAVAEPNVEPQTGGGQDAHKEPETSDSEDSDEKPHTGASRRQEWEDKVWPALGEKRVNGQINLDQINIPT